MQRRHLLSLAALASPIFEAAQAGQDDGLVLTQVTTALGAFVIAVDPMIAPVTVANYLAYVDARHLDNGSVYRIVTPGNQTADTRHKIEVVQWGMNLKDEQPSPLPAIAHETTRQTGVRHLDGTVSMARNAPGTASSEFFICIGDQPELDFGGRRNTDGQGFAAFGRVIAGGSTVRKLYAQGGSAQMLNAPIAISSVRRVPEADRAEALRLL